MDDVYEKAVQRVEELHAEMKILKEYIEMHRRTRHMLGLDSVERKVIESSSGAEGEVFLEAVEPRSEAWQVGLKRPRVTDNPKPPLVIDAVKRIIESAGHPLSRSELYDELKAVDLEVRGADPIKTLGTMLWRASGELVQLKGLGYWLKDVEYRPANYDPDPTFNLSEIEAGDSESVEDEAI